MVRAVKIDDQTIGHGVCGPCIAALPTNSTVFAEGILLSVAGDLFNAHPNPLCVHSPLSYAVYGNTCARSVFIEGRPATKEGSTLSPGCNDTIILSPVNQVKTKVFIE